MAQVELIMPKMGESIIEATILNWVKQVGDTVEVDETILEIATDKVDSEVPSPVAGTIVKLLYDVEDVVAVGEPVAIIETEANGQAAAPVAEAPKEVKTETSVAAEPVSTPTKVAASIPDLSDKGLSEVGLPSASKRFYSPLVRNIAQAEGISQAELDTVTGTGQNGRVTKADILSHIASRGTAQATQTAATTTTSVAPAAPKKAAAPEIVAQPGEEIIEMDRMRKLIAQHMVDSKHTSPHVTSFVEADVTKIVKWRERVKKQFAEKHGQKITYTPIFLEAVTRAILDFPGVNVSVQGDKIIMKKYINLGMAVARPDGNLIVPVIHNADEMNLLGLTKKVNDLADRARTNKLSPAEIQGGTFTLTNVGGFGNVMGTPIINQPQVAILAVGSIQKKPAVLETEHGDVIAIRHKMFLSLSYDHRVVDGMLGGSFLRRIADYLESFDDNQNI